MMKLFIIALLIFTGTLCSSTNDLIQEQIKSILNSEQKITLNSDILCDNVLTNPKFDITTKVFGGVQTTKINQKLSGYDQQYNCAYFLRIPENIVINQASIDIDQQSDDNYSFILYQVDKSQDAFQLKEKLNNNYSFLKQNLQNKQNYILFDLPQVNSLNYFNITLSYTKILDQTFNKFWNINFPLNLEIKSQQVVYSFNIEVNCQTGIKEQIEFLKIPKFSSSYYTKKQIHDTIIIDAQPFYSSIPTLVVLFATNKMDALSGIMSLIPGTTDEFATTVQMFPQLNQNTYSQAYSQYLDGSYKQQSSLQVQKKTNFLIIVDITENMNNYWSEVQQYLSNFVLNGQSGLGVNVDILTIYDDQFQTLFEKAQDFTSYPQDYAHLQEYLESKKTHERQQTTKIICIAIIPFVGFILTTMLVLCILHQKNKNEHRKNQSLLVSHLNQGQPVSPNNSDLQVFEARKISLDEYIKPKKSLCNKKTTIAIFVVFGAFAVISLIIGLSLSSLDTQVQALKPHPKQYNPHLLNFNSQCYSNAYNNIQNINLQNEDTIKSYSPLFNYIFETYDSNVYTTAVLITATPSQQMNNDMKNLTSTFQTMKNRNQQLNVIRVGDKISQYEAKQLTYSSSGSVYSYDYYNNSIQQILNDILNNNQGTFITNIDFSGSQDYTNQTVVNNFRQPSVISFQMELDFSYYDGTSEQLHYTQEQLYSNPQKKQQIFNYSKDSAKNDYQIQNLMENMKYSDAFMSTSQYSKAIKSAQKGQYTSVFTSQMLVNANIKDCDYDWCRQQFIDSGNLGYYGLNNNL